MFHIRHGRYFEGLRLSIQVHPLPTPVYVLAYPSFRSGPKIPPPQSGVTIVAPLHPPPIAVVVPLAPGAHVGATSVIETGNATVTVTVKGRKTETGKEIEKGIGVAAALRNVNATGTETVIVIGTGAADPLMVEGKETGRGPLRGWRMVLMGRMMTEMPGIETWIGGTGRETGLLPHPIESISLNKSSSDSVWRPVLH